MSFSTALAPMDSMFRTVTALVCSLPLLFVFLASRDPSILMPMLGTASAMVVLFAAVWLAARPSRFEVSEEGLRIVFPLWSRLVPRAALKEAKHYPGSSYADEFGYGLRIGVGGLFGTFGWLRFSHTTVETYVSRRHDMVAVECEGRRGLLLTPADADGLVRAVMGA